MKLRPRRVLLVVLTTLVALGLPLSAGLASATAGDVGYVDQSSSGSVNAPTSDKPQSKLWFNAGTWWADMFDTTSQTWHIFRLNRSTEQWSDTGVRIDSRPNTLGDVLWDGTHLYVASHAVTTSSDHAAVASQTGQPAMLYRFSYATTTDTYSLDAGFPAAINNNSSESITIDKDSTGTLWATWTQVSGSSTAGYTNAVYVAATNGSDSAWGAPFVMPTSGASPAPDDISAVVAYGKGAGSNNVGVMWSNQNDDTVYWATHKDGDSAGTWKGSVAVHGTKQPDDHMNLKTLQADVNGRVFAAVKTSLDGLSTSTPTSAQVNLLVFKPGTGSWNSYLYGTLADCHTRPLVMLDDEHATVHVFATAPTASGCPYAGAAGTIYEKTAPMDNPVFHSGRGTPVIRDAASENMNDATSTKQSVNSTTGLVVLASNQSTHRYWHLDESLGSVPTPSPTSTTPSPTSTTPSPTSSAPAGVTVAGSTTAGSAASTAVTLTKPAGTSVGDVLVASFTADLTPTATAPTGWTSFVPRLTPNAGAALFGYYHVVTTTDASTTSWIWTLSQAQKWNGGMTRFQGVNTTTPLDTPVSSAVDNNAAATTLTVPGVTTPTPGDMVIGGVGADGSTPNTTAPAGWTQQWQSTGQQIAEQAWTARLATGATGSATWTLDQGRALAGWLVALRAG